MPTKKAEVSSEFIEKISREIPGPLEGVEAQLDYLLPLYRGIQSEGVNCEAKLVYVKEIIVDALREIERTGESPEYIAKTRRTMGKLVYSPNPIDRKRARSQMALIRNLVSRALGRPIAKEAVRVKYTTTYVIDWDAISKGGPELVEAVRKITGMKPKPALTVGPVTKRAKLGRTR